MSLIVSRVTLEDPLTKQDSEAILYAFALRPDVSKAAIGVLAILHASLHGQGLNDFTIPADSFEELGFQGMVVGYPDGPGRVRVSLKKP